jgi:hypothetical protein
MRRLNTTVAATSNAAMLRGFVVAGMALGAGCHRPASFAPPPGGDRAVSGAANETRAAEPPRKDRPADQGRGQVEPPAPPAPVRCEPDQFQVERCMTEGMARPGPNGPQAVTHCSTRCEDAPPTIPDPKSTTCRQTGARAFHCDSFGA